MRENRSEPRVGILAHVDVLWQDESGDPRIAPARLEDKSPNGLSIRVKEKITIGTRLIIHWEHGHFPGMVSYCISRRGHYILGLRRDQPDDVDAT